MTQEKVYSQKKSTNLVSTKIAISNNVITGYKNETNVTQYYLTNGTEFQINLANHVGDTFGAKIYINDEYLGSMIVLRQYENISLERFIESSNKFKFNVYEVDDNPAVKEIIKKNGNIRVEWFKTKSKYTPQITNDTFLWNPNYTPFYNPFVFGTGDRISVTQLSNINCNTSNYVGVRSLDASNTIKTGRIEEGSKSSQTFKEVPFSFEDMPFSVEHIKLLDVSQKKEPTPKSKTVYYETKVYCGTCGRRMKDKNWKFCPGCGKSF